MTHSLLQRRTFLLSCGAAVLSGCARPSPPFETNGVTLPGSIVEETYLPLKGAREYLLLRGRNRNAPVMLFLHGGPGGSETALMRLFHPQLEDHFVMAYWDQRGAGKSYSADIPASTMTIAQFLDDLDHVVDHLRARLGASKIWLLAHSWGTALGTLYAAAHSEKIAGYIGTGQVASNPMDEIHAYEFVLAEARKRNDADALEELKKIGPPPYDYDRLQVRDGLLQKFGGYFHRDFDRWSVVFRALGTPEADIRDLFRLWHGTAFSQRALWPEFARLDLTKSAPKLDVPVTFVLGRYDQRTYSPCAADYLAKMHAPEKNLVWLEDSAHNGPFEEPTKFREVVIRTAAH
ncbi:MAG: alpha/beta fold hydrolase [Rhizomicrobium sp.]